MLHATTLCTYVHIYIYCICMYVQLFHICFKFPFHSICDVHLFSYSEQKWQQVLLTISATCAA